MRHYLVVLLLLTTCLVHAQDAPIPTETRPYVLKTQLSSHIPLPIDYASVRVAIEIPAHNNWAVEPMFGVSYKEWDRNAKMRFSPHGRVSIFKYLNTVKGDRNIRAGFVYGARAINSIKTHNPCIEHQSSSSWFAEYDCVERIENNYNWNEIDFEIGFIIGRKFLINNWQIDADVNLGFKGIGVEREGYISSLPHGFPLWESDYHEVPDPYSFLAGFDLKIGRVFGKRKIYSQQAP